MTVALRWLARGHSGRKAGARNAAVPRESRLLMPAAGSSPSARTAGPDVAAVPSSASDPRDIAMARARAALAPPPLGRLSGDTMLAVAPVPGKFPEEWQDRDVWPFWIAWPHATGAVHAEEMTAAQLRDILAGRDSHV